MNNQNQIVIKVEKALAAGIGEDYLSDVAKMNEESVIADVLESLKKAGHPCEPREVMANLSAEKKDLDEWSVRKAILQLTADAVIKLTSDLKLKLP